VVTVTVDNPPSASITASSSTTFCQGGNVTLTGNGGSSYSWSTSATTQSITVNQSGTYTVSATNSCGSSTSSQAVTVHSLPTVTFATPNPDTVCQVASPFALTGGSPNGGTYSGAGVSSGNFDPSVAGGGWHTLTYTYTDANSCMALDTTNIFVDICIGIENINNNDGISIYPNPNNGIFTLETKSSCIIKIYNTLGELIYQSAITGNKTEVKIPEAGVGIYQLLILNKSEIIHQKIVIQ
jgi:hypothetical protein